MGQIQRRYQLSPTTDRTMFLHMQNATHQPNQVKAKSYLITICNYKTNNTIR